MGANNKKIDIKMTTEWKGKKLNVNKIGEINENKWGKKYKIIGYVEGKSRLRFVEFLESKEVIMTNNYNIKDGSVSDYSHKSVCGIGISGFKDASKHILYYRWANMLGRCYSEKHSGYKSYGGKGCYVEDYLLDFRNYISFVESLEGYDLLKENPNDYHIDKDLKSKNEKCYSRETLSIITKEKNIKIENKNRIVEVEAYDLNGDFMGSFASITVAEKMTGIHKGNIARTVRGESKTAGGYVWVIKE